MDVVLDRAIGVFRERGYKSTSISHLSEATGLTTGSLYKAFDDKKDIFFRALDRYVARRSEALSEVLSGATGGLERVERAVVFYAEASLAAPGSQGCLLINAATECAAIGDELLLKRVQQALGQVERLLVDLIEEGQADGSISATVNRETSARLMMCLFQGLRVVGAAGLPDLGVRPLVETVVAGLR
ncbi:MAG TPA: TetR/AcrR family transcriptional regulator [Burkholderiaceae bacterium]|nr:TetR/AcrR family transcriptional regulator [Burkholderiaceae bacterium]